MAAKIAVLSPDRHLSARAGASIAIHPARISSPQPVHQLPNSVRLLPVPQLSVPSTHLSGPPLPVSPSSLATVALMSIATRMGGLRLPAPAGCRHSHAADTSAGAHRARTGSRRPAAAARGIRRAPGPVSQPFGAPRLAPGGAGRCLRASALPVPSEAVAGFVATALDGVAHSWAAEHLALLYERVTLPCSSINCGDIVYRRCRRLLPPPSPPPPLPPPRTLPYANAVTLTQNSGKSIYFVCCIPSSLRSNSGIISDSIAPTAVSI